MLNWDWASCGCPSRLAGRPEAGPARARGGRRVGMVPFTMLNAPRRAQDDAR
jgi:hypothetical protein